MNIRALVFDADGVVIFPWRFARLLEEQYGITPADTRPFFQGVFNACMLGKADLRQALPTYLSDWGWPGTVDELIETWLEVENAPDEALLASIRVLRRAGLGDQPGAPARCLHAPGDGLRAYLRGAVLLL